MNILMDRLPSAVQIDEVAVPINTDFRVCLRIIIAMEDEELTTQEKLSVMLQLLYGNDIPANTTSAVEMGIRFLDAISGTTNGGQQEASNEGRLYSFSHDATYIFSAFRQSHGIDLEKEDMHWWKFVTLFMDLDSECFFCTLINLRRQRQKGKMTKEEREYYYRIRHIVDLPQSGRKLDPEEDEFMRLLQEGKN